MLIEICFILVRWSTKYLMDMEYLLNMTKCSKEYGKMEKEFLAHNVKKEFITKGIILMEKSKDLEHHFGIKVLMNTQVNGKMG
jgi:hypothetical protein